MHKIPRQDRRDKTGRRAVVRAHAGLRSVGHTQGQPTIDDRENGKGLDRQNQAEAAPGALGIPLADYTSCW